MPIYVYETLPSMGEEPTRFEFQQSMQEPPLTHHPETGEPVRRVMLPPHLGTRYTPGATQKRLAEDNLARKGFTKYVRDPLTQTYHRTAGSEGPASFKRPA